jgi:ribosomal protein L11
MIPSEDPPAKVSSILLSYNEVKNNVHPVMINYYAKNIQRSVAFTVKVPSTNEELKQELRTSMKSGRRYDYQSKRLGVAFTDDDEGSGV